MLYQFQSSDTVSPMKSGIWLTSYWVPSRLLESWTDVPLELMVICAIRGAWGVISLTLKQTPSFGHLKSSLDSVCIDSVSVSYNDSSPTAPNDTFTCWTPQIRVSLEGQSFTKSGVRSQASSRHL